MKKIRKYQSGGSIDDDVRQRALMYAGLHAEGRSRAAEGFADEVKREQQGIAEAMDAARRSQPEMDRIIRAAQLRDKERSLPASTRQIIEKGRLRAAGKPAPDYGRGSNLFSFTDSEHKKGGAIKMAAGGKVGSASKRADGIAQRGKTRGKVC